MNDAVFLFGELFVRLVLSDPEGGQILADNVDAVEAVIRAIRVFHDRGIDDAARDYCAGLSDRVKIGLIWLLCDKDPEALNYLGVTE
jgi:hypothetical protein